jgi:hypothetical protein
MRLSLLSALLVVGLCVVPVAAHHSFSAEYDSKKVTTITGTVTKVEWMNPHVYFFIDVEGADGKVANWACEMGPPNGLQRSGWTRNTMKIGDEVTVNGTLAKDGSNQVNARTVTMAATGQKLGAASSEGQEKGKQ